MTAAKGVSAYSNLDFNGIGSLSFLIIDKSEHPQAYTQILNSDLAKKFKIITIDLSSRNEKESYALSILNGIGQRKVSIIDFSSTGIAYHLIKKSINIQAVLITGKLSDSAQMLLQQIPNNEMDYKEVSAHTLHNQKIFLVADGQNLIKTNFDRILTISKIFLEQNQLKVTFHSNFENLLLGICVIGAVCNCWSFVVELHGMSRFRMN